MFILIPLLGGVGMPSHAEEVNDSEEESVYMVSPLFGRMSRIEMAIDIHAMRYNGKRPDSLDDLIQPTDEGAPPLLKKEEIIDPWGVPFWYERDGNKFILRSSGPDKIMGTADDIIRGSSESYVEVWKAKQAQVADRQETDTVQAATPEPVTPPPPAAAEPPPVVAETETPRCAPLPARPQNEPAEPEGSPWKLPLLVGAAAAVALAAWLRFRKK